MTRRPGKKPKRQKATLPTQSQALPARRSLKEILLSTPALCIEILTVGATLYVYWDITDRTLPLVTPQANESSSSVLAFKIENPSTIFDMRDVVLGCQVLKIETGPASEDLPVRFITPNKSANGLVLSETRYFTIVNRNPVSFSCGAETVFQMERAGKPYFPPRIEIEVAIQFKTLWVQRRVSHAGPFVATRVDDKYRWTEGITITAEPTH